MDLYDSEFEIFFLKFSSINASLSASVAWIKVTSLDHKFIDNSVNLSPFVAIAILVCAKLIKSELNR